MNGLARSWVTPLVALALVAGLGYATERPALSSSERAQAAGRYSFERSYLNDELPGSRRLRDVQPGLRHIEGWISSVGASVGLADFEGAGVDQDMCLVDVRDDSVTVAPVPGTGDRFAPITLVPDDLTWDSTMAPMGCVPADVNDDGLLDVIVFYWGRSPVLFLRQDRPLGPGAFTADELVQPMQVWNSTTLAVADIDGDGYLDVVVGNYFPDGARVLDPGADDDTWMQMQDSMSLASNAGVTRVLLLRPTGETGARPTVVDATSALPERAARGWTLAIGAQDLDGDGLPEVYLAQDFGNDQLLVNESSPGQVRFRELRGARDWTRPKSTVLGRGSFKGMGVAFTDLVDSPVPSILVSNITTPYALHESNFAFLPTGGPEDFAGDHAPLRNESEQLGLSRSGWAWDIKAGDFDNSGRDEIVQATGFLQGSRNRWPQLQELAMSNDSVVHRPEAWPRFTLDDDLSGHEHNPFWVREGDGRFHDIAQDVGMGALDVTRALAIGDTNRNGRLDLLIGNQWQRSRLYRNTTAEVGRALSLRLRRPATAGEGTVAAIGAGVAVTLPDGRVRRAQLYPANGHTGTSAAELHVGLGDVDPDQPLPVRVTWRDTGGLQAISLELRPGHHELLLTPDGRAEDR